MNISFPTNGTWQKAKYFEWDKVNKNYKQPIPFKYKTFDDTEVQERRTQPQQGQLTGKLSLSMKTYANLPFKIKDKVYVELFDRNFEITLVGSSYKTSMSLRNSLFPSVKGNVPTILYLNKDEV